MNSPFQITRENEDNLFYQVCIKNILTGELIRILPNLGGRLNAALLKINGNMILVVKELKNENLKTRDAIFNNAILFPFANRIRNGKYFFQNKVFQFPLNYEEEGNACHGFLYNTGFNIISENISGEYAEVKLENKSTEDKEGYPFFFKITVIYRLSSNGKVTVTTEIFNLSETEILFSQGWHFYYCLDSSIDNLSLEFNPVEKLELDQNNIPDGKTFKFSGEYQHFDLKNEKLDDLYRFSSENLTNHISIIPINDFYKFKIWHEAGKNKYNYLVLYTPPDRKSIAIEPMTSSIDAFNNKEGLIILKPEESWSAAMGFSLTKK